MRINVILFGRFYILNFTIFIANAKLYYYINNGKPRLLKAIINKVKSEDKFTKLAMKEASKAINFPINIKLYNANIVTYLALDDPIHLNTIAVIINMLNTYLEHNKYVDINGFSTNLMLKNDKLNLKIFVEFTIKYDLLKILFYILRTLIKTKRIRRHYATKSNRRTDGMYAR